MSTEHPRWITSSHSNNGGQCVQVATNLAATHGTIPLRDSKNPAGPALSVHTTAFATFLAGVKTGEFSA